MFFLALWLGPDSAAADNRTARRLRWAALDQEAELRLDSAVILLDHAIAADPAYFPAYFDYIRLLRERGADDILRRRLAPRDARAGVTARCAALMAREPHTLDHQQLARRRHDLLALDRADRNTCIAFAHQETMSNASDSVPARLTIEYSRLATRLAPELGRTWSAYASRLDRNHERKGARAVLEHALRLRLHPLERTELQIQLAQLRLRSEGRAAVRTFQTRVIAAATRDGRPGIRYLVTELYQNGESARAARLALTRAPQARPRLYWALDDAGASLVESGNPEAGLKHHQRQAAIADSLRSPRLQLMAYVRRGRAFSKLGQLEDAERDLRRAVSLGVAANQYFFIEAYHNLAHTYEGWGRWQDAARSADRYAALARTHGSTGQEVMSLHDAGTIRWKAGWHAAARRDFDAMVRVIDMSQREPYWAAEYFERIGDFTRALTYLRRSRDVRAHPQDIPRTLSALTRVFELLGYADSAEVAAREHDAMSSEWPPLETPLVPGLLARRGRLNEAVVVAGAWARRQRDSGNLHGGAIAFLQLSELLLQANQPRAALTAAARAETLAVGLHLTDELIHSQRLQGQANIRMGARANGLRLLRAAIRAARAHPTLEAVRSTELALGNALAGNGRARQALQAYDNAARAVEGTTALLAADLDRVGYRDRHLAPFDGAIGELIRIEHSPQAVNALADWSRRRKAAALALGLDRVAQTAAAKNGFALARVQGALRGDEALLDYMVFDTVVAVLVVTSRSARVLRLPITEPQLRKLVENLRSPLVTSYNGRIDVSRAHFDVPAAQRLYRILLKPVLTALPPQRRLVIAPDGPLHYLPFEILVSSPSAGRNTRPLHASATYVLDDYEILYVPSADWVTRRSPYRTSPRRLLVLAGSAPAAAQEAAAISRAWPPGGIKVLDERTATETALRTARGFDILHIATHAHADGRDPLASHLRLRGDAENDGYFHLSEITAAPRAVRLVVLSACETTSGPLYRGEGLLGLARGFLAGGAGGVVATQWPVGAPTALVMDHFYRALAADASASSALRDARLALRRSPATAHPLFWGGIVLIGGRDI